MQTGTRADDRPQSGRKRLLALLGVVAAVIALPLAVASAGPVGDADHAALRPPVHEDGKRAVPSAPGCWVSAWPPPPAAAPKSPRATASRRRRVC